MCDCLSRAPPLGTWPSTQACALAGNQTCDPLVRRPALNPLSHTSQGWVFFFKGTLPGFTFSMGGTSSAPFLSIL